MKNSVLLKYLTLLLFLWAIIVSFRAVSGKPVPNNHAINAEAGKASAKTEITIYSKTSATKWNVVTSKATVKFGVRGPFGTVHGSIEGLNSTIVFDDKDLAGSYINASVDPKTISTGIGMRNRHLQKEEYLNSEKFPAISFRSEKIQRTGTGFKITGKLTIKGTSKTIDIPFQFTQNGNTGLFKGSFTIERIDYKIGSSGGSIGKTITIDLDVPVTK